MQEYEFKVLKWAAEECTRQQSGEMSVYHMMAAWNWATTSFGMTISEDDIIKLGQLVEPEKNKNGYRHVPVLVGKYQESVVPHSLIPRVMGNICSYTPYGREEDLIVEWYKAFELAHPFIDGNGRVGSILYNYMRGTLLDPVAPPNIFD